MMRIISLRSPRITVEMLRKRRRIVILREERLLQERKILRRRTKRKLMKVMKIHRLEGERARRGFQDLIVTSPFHRKNRLPLKKLIGILPGFRPAVDTRITLLQSRFPLKWRRLM